MIGMHSTTASTECRGHCVLERCHVCDCATIARCKDASGGVYWAFLALTAPATHETVV